VSLAARLDDLEIAGGRALAQIHPAGFPGTVADAPDRQ
jgi:hypothetical protein